MDTLFINQGLKKYINCTQKTNCKNKLTNSNEETNDLCLKCKQIKIKNKKDKLHELLTVDFARYYRANNGDNMNTQFNNDNFEQKNSLIAQKGYSCNKVSVNNKNKSNVTYKKQHKILQSTILLLSWLFVFIFSAMLFYANTNNINFNLNNNVIAEGVAPVDSNSDGIYEINNADNLRYLSTNSSYWGYNFIQTDNIPMNDTSWVPIGNNSTKFTGTYDGGGHKITFENAVTINTEYAGLFGCVYHSAEIVNLGINWTELNFVSSVKYGGGIVGYNSCDIEQCYVEGQINANSSVLQYLGGISGYNEYSIISNCYNNANIIVNKIKSDGNVGGIAGYTSNDTLWGKIECCYNKGDLSVNNNDVYLGGIAGYSSICSISNCFNVGTLNGKGYAAGILAWGVDDPSLGYDSSLNYCYNIGEINATSGQSAGINCNGDERYYFSRNCKYSLPNKDDGFDWTTLDTSLKSSDFTTISTFNGSDSRYIWGSASSGWNFNEIWGLDSGINEGYPYLLALAESYFSNYSVAFDIEENGGDGTAPNGQTVKKNESIQLPTGEYKSGWTFVGWSENSNSTTTGILESPYTPTADVTLYAIFSKEISANFYQTNGTNSKQSVVIYNNAINGQITSPQIITSNGETAIGWASESDTNSFSLEQNTSTTINGGENYYAIVSYVVTITYNGNGHTGGLAVANSTGTAYKTANGTTTPTITQPASILINSNTFEKKYHTFIGWSTNSSATSSQYNVSYNYDFENDTVLYAVWQKTSCTTTITITLNVPAGSNTEIIFNILDGTKKDFVNATQIAVSSTKTITLELEKNKTYTIAITKPFSWQIKYNNGEPTTVNFFEFTTSGTTQSHEIEISGSAVPNIWVVV